MVAMEPVCLQVESEVPLGPKASLAPANLERLTVALDLDECLLHSKFHGMAAAAAYRQEEERPESVKDVNSFWLALDDGFAQVNIRPGLAAFLEALSQTCDVMVFTAAMPDYAAPVLDKLDPTGKIISRRLYRSDCRQVRGAFLKDLGALGPAFDRNPGRCVLLDNNPCSFLCQPTNGILVTSFYDDAEDTALASVLQLVRHLEHVPDVRPILRDMFRLESLLREYRAMLFPEQEDEEDLLLAVQQQQLVPGGEDCAWEPAADDCSAERGIDDPWGVEEVVVNANAVAMDI